MNTYFAISIVVYNPDLDNLNLLLKKIIALKNNCKVFLIDNSDKKNKINYFHSSQIVYIKNIRNIGYGAANNISIKECLKNSVKYLFVINYDISFKTNVFVEMLTFLSVNKDIGLIMPRILYPDGKNQYLPKTQPVYNSIIKRKIFHLTNFFFKKFVFNYEARHLNDSINYNVKNISGCFMLFNLELLKYDALFDERYFLYMEDYDLSRKLSYNYNLILFNKSIIYHDYYSGANKKFKLLYLFLKSYVLYFNKWGWFNGSYNKLNKISKYNSKV